MSSNGDEVRLCLFSADGSETQLLLPERDGDSGTGSCRVWRRDRPTVTGSADRTIARAACVITLPNSCSTPMRERSMATSGSDPNYSITQWMTPVHPARWIRRVRCRAAWYGPRLHAATAGPGHALADTILYEVHVRGFTANHPGVPPELRGTYAGLAHEAAVQHLVDLGVTTVELLPIHHNVPESFLVERD